MALLVAVVRGRDWPFVQKLMGTAGKVMGALDQLIEEAPDGLADELRRLREDARQLRAQRHGLIHSVAILALDDSATGHQVALLNPAKDTLTYPTGDELSSIRQRTQTLAARCIKIAEQFASVQDGQRGSVKA